MCYLILILKIVLSLEYVFSCLLIGLIFFGLKPYVLYKTVNTEVCLFMFKNECDFPSVRTFVWGFVFI